MAVASRRLAVACVLAMLGVSSCGDDAPPAAGLDAGSHEGAVATIEQVAPLPGLRFRPLTDRTFERSDARRERGRYLAEGILQCAICHSDRDWNKPGAPPAAGRELAGHIWKQEGDAVLVAPNLTPDDETGIGRWSDDMLARAIREGISHDGRPLHPQMWYPSFAMLSDEDLASVIVYLRSLKPIRNPLPRTTLPDDVVQGFVGRPAPITEPVPGPADDSPLERGRYLANIGDCGGCHTLWESERLPGAFAGGNAIARDGKRVFSTNITPHATGMAYDEHAFIAIMRNGKQGMTDPMMPWVAFRNLTSTDLAAIHAFLQSRHPFPHRVSNLAAPSLCAVCGMEHGLGSLNALEKPAGSQVPEVLLREYAGTYRNDRYDWTMAIVFEHGNLHAQVEGEPTRELIAVTDRLFVVHGGLGPVRFTRDTDGNVDGLVAVDVDDTRLERIDSKARAE